VASPAPLEHAWLAPVLQLSAPMRVALPAWDGRVSPVFDVANRILVVDIERGTVTRTSDHTLEDDNRVETLSTLGVDVLLCSAISWPVEAMLWVAGIEVVSDICGPIDEVIGAYRSGVRALATFHSPGYSERKHGGRPSVPGTSGQPGRGRHHNAAGSSSQNHEMRSPHSGNGLNAKETSCSASGRGSVDTSGRRKRR
jgi:predicted Fe-Mo cluster-binding NifX family protein